MTGILKPEYEPSGRERTVKNRKGKLSGDPVLLYQLRKSNLAADLCRDYCHGQADPASGYCAYLALTVLFASYRFSGIYPRRPVCLG